MPTDSDQEKNVVNKRKDESLCFSCTGI